VGLNLQAASALINLDMPWNPAVLEQRIARVHRLGQKEPVQVVLLVAQDAYEAHVASLVASKQFLFDNVVRDDASEDVVGVSRRSVELALEALGMGEDEGGEAREEPEDGAEEATGGARLAAEDAATYAAGERDETAQGERASGAGEHPRGDEPEPGPDLGPLVEGLQRILGLRLERILAVGDGLIAVVDRVEAELEQRARELAAELDLGVQAELIDARSYAALKRLGAVAGDAVYERPAEPTGPAPLLAQASRKLEAAEILHGQGHGEEALELMLQAMLHAAAHRAALDAAPRVEEAAVWVFGEAVPKGHIDLEDANAITRAVALAQVPQVPTALLGSIQEDARRLVGREVATA
jgi:fructose-specific component phosphotransferase system IIB-like protein